jgi:hypothetical protein
MKESGRVGDENDSYAINHGLQFTSRYFKLKLCCQSLRTLPEDRSTAKSISRRAFFVMSFYSDLASLCALLLQ